MNTIMHTQNPQYITNQREIFACCFKISGKQTYMACAVKFNLKANDALNEMSIHQILFNSSNTKWRKVWSSTKMILQS